MPRKTRKTPPAEKKPRKQAERVDLTGSDVIDLAGLAGLTPLTGPRSDYDRALLAIQALGPGKAQSFPLGARKGFQDRAKKLGLKLGLGESGGKLVVWVEGKEDQKPGDPLTAGDVNQWVGTPHKGPLSPILEPELAAAEDLVEMLAGAREP